MSGPRVAVIGAVFYTRFGSTPASSVSAMELAMAINAVIVLVAAGLTTLLPRRTAGRRAGHAPERVADERAAEYSTEAVR